MMHDPTVAGQARKGAGGQLAILALLTGMAWLAQGAFGTVQEAAKADLRLDDLRLGLLQGLAVSVPIAVLSVPVGRMIDRASRVRLLFWLSVLWSAGTLLTAVAQGFAMLFVARMMAGLGAACVVSAVISIAADLAPPERRGRALLVLTVGKWAGTAAAFAVAGGLYGALLHRQGIGLAPWRTVFLILGLASSVVTLAAFALREPDRHELGAGQDAPLGIVLRELVDRRAFLVPLFVGQIGVVMADVAAGVWVAPVLGRDYHLAPEQFGGWVGGIVFASGILGSVLGGLFADMGQRSPKRGGMLTSAVWASALGVPAALFPIMPGVGGLAVLLTLLLLTGTLTGLVTSAAIAVFVPNEARGLCLGAFLAIAGLVGFGIAPTLVTGIAALLGGSAHLAPALAGVGVVVGIVSAFAFWVARRNAPAI